MRPINELTLYRYRHLIGYSLLVLLTVGLLCLYISKIPGGLSQAEEASALASSKIVFDKQFLDTTNAVDLPYHLAQWASLKFFGLSAWGVKLPSLLFAASSMLFILLLLRRWLQENVAIAWGIFVATSAWFLTIGRSGTPDVMVIFWTSLILLLATLVSQQAKGYRAWKALGLISVGLSFYTPLMAYLFAASALAAMFQPHLRYIIRYADKTSVTLGTFLFIAILVPLGWHIWRDPIVLRELLAIPSTLPGPIEFFKSLWAAASAMVNPFQNHVGLSITPLLSLPVFAMAAVGLIRTVTDYHSVRSYVLLLWIAVLTPVIGLNPTALNVLFVPVILFGAIGIQSLFRYWYDLFPRNPYARVFGLLPLVLLIGSVATLNYQRYFTGMAYTKSTVSLYSPDAILLHDTIASKSYRDQRITLVVSPDKKELYSIDKNIAKNLTVVTPSEFVMKANANNIIVSTPAMAQLTPGQKLLLPTNTTSMLVSDRKEDALRFRVYSQ